MTNYTGVSHDLLLGFWVSFASPPGISCTNTTFYRHVDGDGHGFSGNVLQACTHPEGYVSKSTDCDDNDEHEDDDVYIEPVKQERSKTLVYPNPATDKGKIAFVSKQTGFSSVELFNIHGQKVGTLFEAKIKKGDEVEIEYDATRLPEGIYFAIIKNGTDVYKEKISITN